MKIDQKTVGLIFAQFIINSFYLLKCDVMLGLSKFDDLEYTELVDLLSYTTKQYTTELVRDRKWAIEDEKVYFISLLIKEIELRVKKH